MSWTDERIETLRSLWEKGLTASQIAEKLGEGLSRNAVIGKAHRLGLKSRPSPVKGGDTAAAASVAAPAPKAAAPKPAPAPKPAAPVAAAPAAPAAAMPKPAPRVIAPVTGTGKTSLLELSDKVCKWPIGHPNEVEFHFCGKPSQAGFPYCTDHCLVAYQAQLPRRDRGTPSRNFAPGIRPR
jgi:GcrA cell cycle regulator